MALDAHKLTAHDKLKALGPDMVLEADILSEQRKLYERLLEPLYSPRGTFVAS